MFVHWTDLVSSETLRDQIVFIRKFGHWLIYLTQCVATICRSISRRGCIACACTSCTVLQILNILLVQVASAHVLICAAVTSFTCWDAVSLRPEVHPETCWHFLTILSACIKTTCLNLLAWLVEVLGCVVRRAERAAVEIVEHQVHILSLLVLQIVSNLNVSMHLNFNMGVSLARQGTRFSKATLVHELLVG